MKRLLNTLFVTTPGSWLAREGEAVVVRRERETRLRVPVHTLESVICFGRVNCTTGLIELCGGQGVPISFLTEHGRFIGRIEGPVSGNVLLRRTQYRWADDLARAAQVAGAMVAGKLANARAVLLRAVRDRPEGDGVGPLEAAARGLLNAAARLKAGATLDEARGMEGEGARAYFGVFNHLIAAQKEEFFFAGRSRRPPLDNLNALLSFVYTLLAHDVAAAAQGIGLDPAVGFLHRDRPGRPGLALDLMEELRPALADRLVLSLVNLRQVQGTGFRTTETGAVTMDEATRKAVIVAWQKRKQEEITHPYLGEKVAVGLLPYVQALLLARHLRGDLEGYPPLIWK